MIWWRNTLGMMALASVLSFTLVQYYPEWSPERDRRYFNPYYGPPRYNQGPNYAWPHYPQRHFGPCCGVGIRRYQRYQLLPY